MSTERFIGVALDYSASSKYALKWVVDNLVREGDQLIVVIVHKDYSPNDGQYQLFGKYGSRKHPLFHCLGIFCDFTLNADLVIFCLKELIL
jgi:hypothetical protein